ncbi:MAG: cob(I)yrinic acid a,c-diamide adenosyltransferase [Bacteroidales bacterium]|jgi:cob(I)alamin adenosyltransferase|nr:cob(I)yrinic acid a,c-diamide adenosyltransferase [Bacteroidales bacterium]
MKGYIQVYTGNGKGKTTAAFGQALRAIGAGFTVFIGQFVKGKTYNENIVITKHLKNITLKQYGLGCFIVDTPTDKDIEAAQEGLFEMKKVIQSGMYDMVIMDEVNIALYFKLFDVDEIVELMKNKPDQVELILTGRYAPDEIIDLADIVTEMKEVKHYYQKGIQARKGVEF